MCSACWSVSPQFQIHNFYGCWQEGAIPALRSRSCQHFSAPVSPAGACQRDLASYWKFGDVYVQSTTERVECEPKLVKKSVKQSNRICTAAAAALFVCADPVCSFVRLK